MRLVINSRNCNANAGLNRYKGEGIYQGIGRKHTGLRKFEKDGADAGDLTEKCVGEGINFSPNTMENVDVVDSSSIGEPTKLESDEESSMETISNYSNETDGDKDKESIEDDEEKSAHNDRENTLNGQEVKEKSDEETLISGVKRKFPASFVDSIINQTFKEGSQPKLPYLDSSIAACHDKNGASTSSDVNNFGTQRNELLENKKEDHFLIKIPPTKHKKYSQKACVHCRQKNGVRNDTRYICKQCDVALCKEPCFAVHHCNT